MDVSQLFLVTINSTINPTINLTTDSKMGYVYIVADPSSANFKFGFSSKNDESRLNEYKTSFHTFTKLIFPCDNPREVESSLKLALSDFVLTRESGYKSETCARGMGNANLLRAVEVLAAITMATHVRGPACNDGVRLEPDIPVLQPPFDRAQPRPSPFDHDQPRLVIQPPPQGRAGTIRHGQTTLAFQAVPRDPPVSLESADYDHLASVMLQKLPASMEWSQEHNVWIKADGGRLTPGHGDAVVKQSIDQFLAILRKACDGAPSSTRRTFVLQEAIASLEKPRGRTRFLNAVRMAKTFGMDFEAFCPPPEELLIGKELLGRAKKLVELPGDLMPETKNYARNIFVAMERGGKLAVQYEKGRRKVHVNSMKIVNNDIGEWYQIFRANHWKRVLSKGCVSAVADEIWTKYFIIHFLHRATQKYALEF